MMKLQDCNLPDVRILIHGTSLNRQHVLVQNLSYKNIYIGLDMDKVEKQGICVTPGGHLELDRISSETLASLYIHQKN